MSAPSIPAEITRELYDALMAARTIIVADRSGACSIVHRKAGRDLATLNERIDGALADAGDYMSGGGK